MLNPMDTARLLPWSSPEGKPCYLIGGTGTGYVSRLADRVEAEQMDAAAECIEEAGDVLSGRAWTPGELHLLAVELNVHLARIHRVSESRGARLVQWEGERDGDDEGDEDGEGGVDDAGGGYAPAEDFPDRNGPEGGRHTSRTSPRARLGAPVRPAGSVPGAPLKGAARGSSAR
ncbi:hypothetical protein [Streptomyces sp. CB02959]|uniref:hypothetical protein n=1 Tax=Streptomyces sp. CB02959 TaxID=2020330 RepID=UPI0021536022|nr:hypothetical protein [Streptomyces sp. CB02959]